MILAVDVHYTDDHATAAGVVFGAWQDTSADTEVITTVEGVDAYRSGRFFTRELPCILKLLHEHRLQPDCVIVDGYVFLDGSDRAGLGKHLFDALHEAIPVIGVAKRAHAGIDSCYQVFRGKSRKPLYVTAVGVGIDQAKEWIRTMHGAYRLPTLLKRVDQLSRSTTRPYPPSEVAAPDDTGT